MYLPRQFESTDRGVARDIVRAAPLASLISTDDGGLPFVSHLPLHLEEGEGPDGEPRWLLLGHCARPNPQWRHLQARPTAVVTFLGPHAYQSPRIYPDLQRVPSWNYLAVHCTVTARLVEEVPHKDRLLKHLIGDHEPAYAQQWRDLPEEFTHRLMAGIVAFELHVDALQCKLKLNQHRPESHDALKAAYRHGGEHARALAGWMDRLGLGAASTPTLEQP